jgi:hypothetical protein
MTTSRKRFRNMRCLALSGNSPRERRTVLHLKWSGTRFCEFKQNRRAYTYVRALTVHHRMSVGGFPSGHDLDHALMPRSPQGLVIRGTGRLATKRFGVSTRDPQPWVTGEHEYSCLRGHSMLTSMNGISPTCLAMHVSAFVAGGSLVKCGGR